MRQSRFASRVATFVARTLLIAAVLLRMQAEGFAYHFFYMQDGSSNLVVKWASFPVSFLVDNGPTNIMAELQTARSAWNNIATAKDVLGTFTAATVDFTGANFGASWGNLNGDGQQEVILDEDGTAFAAVGLDPGSVNGFGATRTRIVGGLGVIDDAFLLLNGTRNDFDRMSTEVHELGHIQGLAHSSVGMYNSASINGEFGAMTPTDALDPISVTSVPTMHPFADNTGTSRRTPKADDIAALSELYPEASFATTYGSISGTVTRCSDGTPLTGVNVRIVNAANANIQLTRFTGFDGNISGAYTISGVPPGSYRLLIEGLGANGFILSRFASTVPSTAANDFPSEYFDHPCGATLPGTANNVAVAAGGSSGGNNLKTISVDGAFVVDNTGSMSDEIAVVKTQFATLISSLQDQAKADGTAFPTIAVVTFIDTPKINLISNDPAQLQAVIAAMSATGGGDCPEPSNEAILTASRALRNPGWIFFATDADSDANGPSTQTVTDYRDSKSISLGNNFVSGIVSGTCNSEGLASPGIASLSRKGQSNEEFQRDPPLGQQSAIQTFSELTTRSGGIFAFMPEVKSRTPEATEAYKNAFTNIALASAGHGVGVLNPGSTSQGATVDVLLKGLNTNFTATSSVAFSDGGITINSRARLSATTIQLNLTVAATASLGFRDVTVTTDLGGGTIETAKGIGAFQIILPPPVPVILSVAPSRGTQGQSLDVTIAGFGTHFTNGLSSANFGTGVTVNSLLVTGATTATANVTVTDDAPVTFHTVSVTTGGEVASESGTGLFLVAARPAPRPLVTAINPTAARQGQTLDITITGENTHFVDGVSVASFNKTGIAVNHTRVGSPTTAVVTITISGSAPPGIRSVQVVTGDETATALDIFEVQVLADATPPVIVSHVEGTLGDHGWYVSNVTVSWDVSDHESGVASMSGCSPTPLTDDTAGIMLTCKATNGVGLTSSASATVKIDKTPPILNAVIKPAPNAHDWNKTSVIVSFTAIDSLSGVASVSSPVAVHGEEAGQIVTGSATDRAGNRAKVRTVVNIDKTPPEAYLQFDPVSHDVVLFGRDALSGVLPGPLTPKSVVRARRHDDDAEHDDQRDFDRHDGSDSELRTYQVLDLAGNSLIFVLQVSKTHLQIQSEVISLRYETGAVIAVPKNSESFEWDLDGDKVAALKQEFSAGSGKDAHRVEADFDLRRNQTTIVKRSPNRGEYWSGPGLCFCVCRRLKAVCPSSTDVIRPM